MAEGGQGLDGGCVRETQGKRKCLGPPGKTGLSRWVGTVICQLSGHTDRDRQDGFPPATSPWAASGLTGSTGERGKAMPETFTLLPGASPPHLPLKLSSDYPFPKIR